MSFICCDLLKGWVRLTKGQRRYFVLSFFRCSVAMLYQTNCCSYMIDDVSCLILRYCNSKHLHTTYQQKEYKENVFVLNTFRMAIDILYYLNEEFMSYISIFLLYQKECIIHHRKYYQHQYQNDGSNWSVIFNLHNLLDNPWYQYCLLIWNLYFLIQKVDMYTRHLLIYLRLRKYIITSRAAKYYYSKPSAVFL